jgi:hypothetical protein
MFLREKYHGPSRSSVKYPIQQGQVLLVVVLLMVVVLTIGLSVAARNITNLRQTSEEDQSQRAFSAAEAGIEVALQQSGDQFSGNFNESGEFITQVRTVQGREFIVNNGKTITPNESVDVWLSNFPTTPSGYSVRSAPVTIHWGSDGADPCDTAALEVTLLSGTTTNPSIRHYAFDPCDTTRAENNFTAASTPGGTVQDTTYRFRESITINEGLLMRVIPLHHSTTMAVVSDTAEGLPAQGKIIESTGTSGETKRKIVVFQGFPKLPIEVFPYTLFTPNN